MLYFAYMLAGKYVNLIMWLKVYLAFKELYFLKILSVMRMQNKL